MLMLWLDISVTVDNIDSCVWMNFTACCETDYEENKLVESITCLITKWEVKCVQHLIKLTN